MFEKKKYDKNGFDENGYNKFGFDKFGYSKQGFDKDGYDRHGFNAEGFHKITGLNKAGFDKDGFDVDGFDPDGYDRDGYNRTGYDEAGYDRDGFNECGFDKNGFGRDGYTAEGFDSNGFDRDGFNVAGFDVNGFNREGYNADGYNKNGYNRQGYNSSGFNVAGFDIEGYDANGYDIEGFDRDGFNSRGFDHNGYNAEGYDIAGFDKNGYDKNGYNTEGYDVNGFDRTGYDEQGFNKAGFDKWGYNSDGFDANGYDRAGYNCQGFDKNGYDKWGFNDQGFDFEGYNKEGYNQNGYDRKGFDRQGYDIKGYNKDGFDLEGYNRSGFDRNGYNKAGVDKYGFTRAGYDADGFDLFGRDSEGYGLDGFDKAGFNREGLNRDGFHRDDFDELGFNKYTGLNARGYDKDGYNVNGLNAEGYDKDGYDLEGYDKEGYDRDGFNQNGVNKNGYGRDGYNGAGYNEAGFDKAGYNKDGFDQFGFNRAGFDKEGYDRNGLNANGKRKALITRPDQIKHGLRIKNKKTGERGRIDAVSAARVIFTMDLHRGTGIRTEASVEAFMDQFYLDDDGLGADHERESAYNVKTRQYLYAKYLNAVLIPNLKANTVLRERKYYDKNGLLVTEMEQYDELQIAQKANEEAGRIANEAYFAHVDYAGNPDLYIGKRELPGYVIDWADKRAAYYYEYKIHVPNKMLGINCVRDITLKQGYFVDFHDLYNRKGKSSEKKSVQYVNVADEKLIEIIERNRSSKTIHDIVESIQAKQYEIITQDMNKDMLVLGCAGSGKTMILLHRIRYMLFNNPDVDSSRTIIVSPTDILGKESKELAKILNIDRVKQCTTANFYVELIRAVFRKMGLFHRADEFRICEASTVIDNAAVITCQDIISEKLFTPRRSRYVSVSKKKLLDEKKQLEAIIGSEYIQRGNSYYRAAIQELSRYSEAGIERIISYARSKIEIELDTKKRRKLALQYLLDHLKKGAAPREDYDKGKIQRRLRRVVSYIDKIDIAALESISLDVQHPVVRFVQAVSLLSGVRNEKETHLLIDDVKSLTYAEIEYFVSEVQMEIKLLDQLDTIQRALVSTMGVVAYSGVDDVIDHISLQDIIPSFENLYQFACQVEFACDSANVNPFKLFGANKDIEDEMQMLDNANRSKDYVFDMILRQLSINRDRMNKTIIVNKLQLQKLFHIILQAFKVTDNRAANLFLDEFQDYSVEELNDIRRYFTNAVFNLYGDVKQCITAEGIDRIDSLHKTMSFDCEYELMENYRNASDITAYVNERFGMKMHEIGLSGRVKESKAISLAALENNDRAAIIIANEAVFQQMDLSLLGTTVCNYSEEGAIKSNCYNVLTVAQAKGLEFERVIVVDKHMTQNQLYVACTRAIRDLEIVTMTE